MNCPKCNFEIREGLRFCTNCGEDVQIGGTPPASHQPTPVAPASDEPLASRSRTLPFLAGVGVTTLAIALLALGYFLGQSGGNDAGSGSVPSRSVTATVRPAPTHTAVPAPLPPTSIPILNRFNCASIRGTNYLSDEERGWFLGNCVPTQTPSTRVVNSSDLNVGDCFTGPTVAASQTVVFGNVTVVPCTGVWTYQVLSQFDVTGQTQYPSDAFFENLAAQRCPPAYSVFIFPTLERWGAGGRRITCLLER